MVGISQNMNIKNKLMKKLLIILFCSFIADVSFTYAQSSVTADQLERTKWHTTQLLKSAPNGTKCIELAFDRCPLMRLIYKNVDPYQTKVEYWYYSCRLKQPDSSNVGADIGYEVYMCIPDDELHRVAPIQIVGHSLTVQFSMDFSDKSDITFTRM